MHARRLFLSAWLSLVSVEAPALEWSVRTGPFLADRPGRLTGDAWSRFGASAAVGVERSELGARWHPRLEVGYAHLPVDKERIRAILARADYVGTPATSPVGLWSGQAGLRFDLPWPQSKVPPFLLMGLGYLVHHTNGEGYGGHRTFMGSEVGPFVDLGAGVRYTLPTGIHSFLEARCTFSDLDPGNYVSRYLALRTGISLR